MQARLALVAAIACGALAVTAVAVDLAYTLTVSLDTLDEGGEWQIVQRMPSDGGASERDLHFSGAGCTGPDIRVVIDNNRPIDATRDVYITYHNASSGRDTVVVDERVQIDSMARQTYHFTIPSIAFTAENETDNNRPWAAGPGQTSVNVQVDELFVGSCVARTAPAAGGQKGAPQ